MSRQVISPTPKVQWSGMPTVTKQSQMAAPQHIVSQQQQFMPQQQMQQPQPQWAGVPAQAVAQQWNGVAQNKPTGHTMIEYAMIAFRNAPVKFEVRFNSPRQCDKCDLGNKKRRWHTQEYSQRWQVK